MVPCAQNAVSDFSGGKEGLALSGNDIARAEIAHTDMWRRFETFLESYEYFILPTTQLSPFDVNTPWPTEINGVHLTNYIDWMKSCWYLRCRLRQGPSATSRRLQ